MWTVRIAKKAEKNIKKLPKKVHATFIELFRELIVAGPRLANRPHFGKIGKEKFHCHLNKGRPTYVVCWEIIDKRIKVSEIYFVGTHEKAPY